MSSSIKYDDISIINCYFCPCGIYSNKIKQRLQVTGKLKIVQCTDCSNPWPLFDHEEESSICLACRSLSHKVVVIPHKCCGFTCTFCGGYIPHCVILEHFNRITSADFINNINSKSNLASQPPTIDCPGHQLEYRFCNGEFFSQCSVCNFSEKIVDDNVIMEHSNDFRICCNILRTMYSAMEYNNYAIIQCKECLLVMVVKLDKTIFDFLSCGHFGTPFSERKISSITDLQPGDHLVYLRALYEHHVIVTFVDTLAGEYHQIGYSTPKVKGKSQDEYEMVGRVLSLKVAYKLVEDPMIVIDYLPLDNFPVGVSLIRALSKLNEEDYSIFSNNCEHFTTWCKYGRYECVQIRKIFDRYAQKGADLINTQVVPMMMMVCDVIDNVAKEETCFNDIHSQIISKGQELKSTINNTLEQLFIGKKPIHEKEPNHNDRCKE